MTSQILATDATSAAIHDLAKQITTVTHTVDVVVVFVDVVFIVVVVLRFAVDVAVPQSVVFRCYFVVAVVIVVFVVNSGLI